jgi:TFIIF-interacting CTD phosphatase-like protein
VSKPLGIAAKGMKRTFLIPDQVEHHKGRKTLVLDLDETLVHSSMEECETPDFVLNVSFPFYL